MDTEAECRAEIQKCLAEIKKIEDDPKNQNPKGSSIYLYTPSARKKLDKWAMRIAHWMSSIRTLQGNPVPCNGYSGRNSNRR